MYIGPLISVSTSLGKAEASAQGLPPSRGIQIYRASPGVLAIGLCAHSCIAFQRRTLTGARLCQTDEYTCTQEGNDSP
jgi:hypothetical protein